MRCSELVSGRRAGALALAIGAWVGAPPSVTAQSAHAEAEAQHADGRFAGEYGLYVARRGDSLDVRWLTERPAAGVLAASAGTLEEERHTPEGLAHRATFVLPEAETVTLRYGPEGGELAETVIRPPAVRPTPMVSGVDSIYVVGDSHGQFDTIVRLLYNAGLIDAERRWSGGGAHLVMLGDMFDRGPDVIPLLWFLYRLEGEAAAAGGAVHTVLGNHEVMVMTNDLRYVNGREYLVARRHGLEYPRLFDPKSSVLGQWLATRPGLLRIDDVLLAHGGVSPLYARYGLQEFQDSLAAYIDEELFTRWDDDAFLQQLVDEAAIDSASFARRFDFFFSPQSVLWYRDLVQSDSLASELEDMLKHFESSVHVVGHTPVRNVTETYGGRLIAVDLAAAGTELLELVRGRDGTWMRRRIAVFGEPQSLVSGRSRH